MAKRRIVLGITGGVAAYKAAELARLLVKDGMEVQVVMTEAATRFIGAATLQALTGRPVYSGQWNTDVPDGMPHIALSRGVDAILVAPATAGFMSRLVQGASDDLLSALCLARETTVPLLLAPAMNRQMWENPATQRNAAQLAADGVVLLGPASGEQACGETGAGRMLEPEDIHKELLTRLRPQALAGQRVLITAGPTFEAIDAVRGITNRSSGKMGYAVAQAALEAGAQVTLISGPCALTPPAGATVEQVVSTQDMFEAVQRRVKEADVFISVAAVADYRVDKPAAHKLKKSERALELKLVPAPDILAWVAALPKPPFCVGFAAESEKLQEQAEEKRRRKKVPLLAANLVQDAIGSDDNELTLLDDNGAHVLPRAPKLEIARGLIAHLAGLLSAPRGERPSNRRVPRPQQLH